MDEREEILEHSQAGPGPSSIGMRVAVVRMRAVWPTPGCRAAAIHGWPAECPHAAQCATPSSRVGRPPARPLLTSPGFPCCWHAAQRPAAVRAARPPSRPLLTSPGFPCCWHALLATAGPGSRHLRRHSAAHGGPSFRHRESQDTEPGGILQRCAVWWPSGGGAAHAAAGRRVPAGSCGLLQARSGVRCLLCWHVQPCSWPRGRQATAAAATQLPAGAVVCLFSLFVGACACALLVRACPFSRRERGV
jgi:hypothetical protein